MEEDGNIFQELLGRFKEPWCPSFVMYLILIIIGLGGIGIWLPLLKDGYSLTSLITNIVSYSCALIAPAMLSIILSIISTKHKVSLALVIIGMVVFVSSAVLYTVFRNSIVTAMLCALLAIVAWIIANYDNPELNDTKFNISENIKKNSQKFSKNW
ncbi:MAG: hypothetical protein LKI18_04110 [Prevotella sp.]|jgi:hypothetical protein|nr:hypothetical protein [Prevotella sp.]